MAKENETIDLTKCEVKVVDFPNGKKKLYKVVTLDYDLIADTYHKPYADLIAKALNSYNNFD